MIQIDDAGSGSLVGGTSIGAMRTETGQFYMDIIPTKLYDEKKFKKRLYLKYATKIVIDAFEVLKPDKDETIEICQGYMFDEVRKYLDSKKYIYVNTRIGDPLQTVIEESFENYVISLGLPYDFIKFTKYPFHFHRMLRWVYADYNNRVKLCKTGWKSWQKYGNLKISTYYDIIYNGSYYCLKCGKRIHKASPVKVLKYISNMPNTIYLHKTCPKDFS